MNRRALNLSLLSLSAAPGLAFAQNTPGSIKVGVLTDLSGPFMDIVGPGSVEAARMAAEDAGGSVAGRRVEIVAADHLNRPDNAVSIARRWYDNEDVSVIADLPLSSVALAVQALGRDRKRISLVTASGSDALTNEDCSPYSIDWTFTASGLSAGTVKALLSQGHDSWFFITADYAFGHSLEAAASAMVRQAGGQVLGSVRHPVNSNDMSSYLLQARQSRAKVIAIASTGPDAQNVVKGAADFGLTAAGQKLAALLMYDSDVRALGLQAAQGLILTLAYYWDLDEGTRRFAERFFARRKVKPNMLHAGLYSAVSHYLKAVAATATTDPDPVMAWIRANPVNDFFARNGVVRQDGLMVHDMFVLQVKSLADSTGPWDILKPLQRIPGDQAFPPLSASTCKLLAG
ncbi:ABC transporter substrate-binding protein [Siccirubricoccus deserti]|uniref:ABC transporter substrate-binding protein n=1 Tax=Siccirubricoccus deserti TaxID=2013562 RepID=A0A9X0UEP5_9PROT|nr:ABC transporter substrate-binding protein [Siccirubricoccus deserti]MBC4017877.1 ABC transporter substrate-binding protein [Siccirubricoccus deserti]GGC53480.1 ABC transporter substrate-binding protein [Siccirubricoccus deserti]